MKSQSLLRMYEHHHELLRTIYGKVGGDNQQAHNHILFHIVLQTINYIMG